jgi:hypothetical protein
MENELPESARLYLSELEKHLNLKGPKGREILAEALSDLLALVDRHRDEGMTEEEAFEHSLEEMGDPAEAASEIKAAIPPPSALWLKIIRGLASLFIMYLGWGFLHYTYANTYNRGLIETLGELAFLSFFFVPALLLWPTVIWRKNWLFSVVPAAAGFLVVMTMMTLGTASSQSMSSGKVTDMTILYPSHPGQEIDRSTIALHRPNLPSAQIRTAATILLLVTAYLFWLIQRKNQRYAIIGLFFTIFALYEISYRMEEAKFNAILHAKLDERDAELAKASSAPEDGEFALNWESKRFKGFNFNYSSSRNYLWIRD